MFFFFSEGCICEWNTWNWNKCLAVKLVHNWWLFNAFYFSPAFVVGAAAAVAPLEMLPLQTNYDQMDGKIKCLHTTIADRFTFITSHPIDLIYSLNVNIWYMTERIDPPFKRRCKFSGFYSGRLWQPVRFFFRMAACIGGLRIVYLIGCTPFTSCVSELHTRDAYSRASSKSGQITWYSYQYFTLQVRR